MTQQTLLTVLALILIPAVVHADDAQKAAARMAQEHQHDKPAPTPAATQEPAHPVSAEEVTYAQAGGKPVHGYLARPREAKGNLPALVVIHEWWGLNDNIRAMTRRLAGEGYQALAVDLYGGATADNPDAAMKLMNGVMANRAPAADNLKQAVAWLKGRGATRIGVIGWCFGGGWSLQTALLAPNDIGATVIYYGHLETDPAKLAILKSPVIGFFGADDKSIPVDGVHAFETELKKQGRPVEVHVYDGAGHAFANPSGGSYRPEAARDAWQRTTAFLAKYLKGGDARKG
ncbi:MAG TPA: dienelactone hydrolase family protein [Thermoanaerobaculia bacterium]|jgi:carboxymethylenebutenolidase|nr:dienelactone hydrolase family protein [Thermoanaerobaculia bacterium]